jgi:hypothetical protein
MRRPLPIASRSDSHIRNVKAIVMNTTRLWWETEKPSDTWVPLALDWEAPTMKSFMPLQVANPEIIRSMIEAMAISALRPNR